MQVFGCVQLKKYNAKHDINYLAHEDILYFPDEEQGGTGYSREEEGDGDSVGEAAGR